MQECISDRGMSYLAVFVILGTHYAALYSPCFIRLATSIQGLDIRNLD